MKDFYQKEEYVIEDILLLIKNGVEESIYLDFKDAKALDMSDTKKKDISKDVASFANSDGGIIVYGLSELNHKAHEISYIDGNTYTKEWLEHVINSSIQRRISDVIVYPIRNNGKIEETIYLVKIPKSYDAPHLSRDKRFYKRFNFESVPMEEFEIRQLYGQKLKSKLVLERFTIAEIGDDFDDHKFRFEVQVTNEGDIPETSYKVNVTFKNFNKYLRITWPQNLQNYDYTRFDDNKVIISVHGINIIYPNETLNVARFEVITSKDDLSEAFENVSIEISLMYSNGNDEMKTELSGMIKGVVEDSKTNK